MNIKEIAVLAENPVAAVSRVINNKGNVSEGTCKCVIDVIETAGYVPNLAGRALLSQRN